MIIVRPFQKNDSAAIATILKQMRSETYPGALAGETDSSHRKWLNMYTAEKKWVAETDGLVCGHIQVMHAGNDIRKVLDTRGQMLLEVSRLFVAPNARMQGIGRHLLKTASTWVTDAGGVPVLCVSNYLVDAITLYKAAGWSAAGEIRSSLNNDRLLVMVAGKNRNLLIRKNT